MSIISYCSSSAELVVLYNSERGSDILIPLLPARHFKNYLRLEPFLRHSASVGKLPKSTLFFLSAVTCFALCWVELRKDSRKTSVSGTGEAHRFPAAHVLLNFDSGCETVGKRHCSLPSVAPWWAASATLG